MIEEKIRYEIVCDNYNCYNRFYGEEDVRESEVIRQAKDEDWIVEGNIYYCPEHRG